MSADVDLTRLSLLLNELRLPAIKQCWSRLAERSDKEGWPAIRLLMALAEHEIAERARRRIERHLAEAKLLAGKTLENFDFNAVPMLSKAQISALCAGDAWLRNGSNLILVGPPGTGKSHLSSAIGLSLIEQGWKVLFARTSELVQRLQVAPANLPWRRPSIGSSASIWLSSTTSPTSPKTRPRPRCCSNSSALDTNAAPC